MTSWPFCRFKLPPPGPGTLAKSALAPGVLSTKEMPVRVTCEPANTVTVCCKLEVPICWAGKVSVEGATHVIGGCSICVTVLPGAPLMSEYVMLDVSAVMAFTSPHAEPTPPLCTESSPAEML